MCLPFPSGAPNRSSYIADSSSKHLLNEEKNISAFLSFLLQSIQKKMFSKPNPDLNEIFRRLSSLIFSKDEQRLTLEEVATSKYWLD